MVLSCLFFAVVRRCCCDCCRNAEHRCSVVVRTRHDTCTRHLALLLLVESANVRRELFLPLGAAMQSICGSENETNAPPVLEPCLDLRLGEAERAAELDTLVHR